MAKNMEVEMRRMVGRVMRIVVRWNYTNLLSRLGKKNKIETSSFGFHWFERPYILISG